MSTPIPIARDDDPEDVSWALSTAATSFARGDRVEALKWLRRAAEAASEAERDARALELAKAAAELSTLPATPVTPATPSRPPPAASRPPPPAPSRPPPPAPSRPPPPAPSRPPPPAPSRPVPAPRPSEAKGKAASGARGGKGLTTSKSKADETGKRSAMRKSMAGEVQRTRAPSTPEDKTQTHETLITEVRPPLKTPSAAVVSATDADSWPTETSDPTDENSVYGQERTRIGTPAYKADRPRGATVATQAVRVVIWRGPDGALRVAPQGTAVSAVAMEAMLVALEPDADLLAWLAPL
jgi:hypothetical protein